MARLLKTGRVVVVLSGRFAGKKAIVVQSWDRGHKKRNFSHCLVAGIASAPRRVTKNMSKLKAAKRSTVKAFVKTYNYNHVMPTRYSMSAEIDLKPLLNEEKMRTLASRKAARTAIGRILHKRFVKAGFPGDDKITKDATFARTRLRF